MGREHRGIPARSPRAAGDDPGSPLRPICEGPGRQRADLPPGILAGRRPFCLSPRPAGRRAPPARSLGRGMTGPSLFILSLATPLALCAQAPRPLGDSDLAVGSVEFAQDSSQVRRALGAPVSTDSTKWQYADLRVWFSEGKVHQIEILGRRLATRRGLRIGDKAGRATGLYGPSCVAGAF